MRKIQLIILLLVLGVFVLGGCVSYLPTLPTSRARIGAPTEVNKDLVSLPVPKDKVYVAVYKFRDQTGQYKASTTGANWSTAVTQGATSILLRALDESGWFIPIEREGLSDLLNERKIIRSSRANYNGKPEDENALIPPLLYAGIILEGGIISYDTNVMTGGAGAEYFGISGNAQYREDRVSIYLRATSTQNGRILKTVYTTKTILSQMVDIGFFRFVSFQRLLEAETGYTYNEPIELCITEAIEKAVQSMAIEGIFSGLWELKDKNDMNSPSIKNYLKEKEEMKTADNYGHEKVEPRYFGLGINAGLQLYSGDYPNPKTKPAGQLFFTLPVMRNLKLGFNLGYGQLADDKYYTTTLNSVEFQTMYQFSPQSRVSPYLILGGSVSNFKVSDQFGAQKRLSLDWLSSVSAGIGLEAMISDKFGINFILDNHYMLNDNVDGIAHGKLNDYYWGARVGLTFYPGF